MSSVKVIGELILKVNEELKNKDEKIAELEAEVERLKLAESAAYDTESAAAFWKKKYYEAESQRQKPDLVDEVTDEIASKMWDVYLDYRQRGKGMKDIGNWLLASYRLPIAEATVEEDKRPNYYQLGRKLTELEGWMHCDKHGIYWEPDFGKDCWLCLKKKTMTEATFEEVRDAICEGMKDDPYDKSEVDYALRVVNEVIRRRNSPPKRIMRESNERERWEEKQAANDHIGDLLWSVKDGRKEKWDDEDKKSASHNEKVREAYRRGQDSSKS